MTKLMPLRSIEHGIRRAFAILGNSGIEQALAAYLGSCRSDSLIRKCGEPDDKSHHLHLHYAIALDRACLAAAAQMPLREAYEHLVKSGTHHPDMEESTRAEIYQEVVHLQAVLADLAHKVTRAQAPDSDAREALSPMERHGIFEAIDAPERHAEYFKTVIARDGG